MRWLPAENELGREQTEFLDGLFKDNHSKCVVGFPGSGKTVLMLYSVVNLKKKNKDAKILIVEFTHALIKMLSAAIKELNKEENYAKLNLNDVCIKTYYDFYNSVDSYDYIICDEYQDIPPKVLKRMNIKSNRVLLSGDPNQSIYSSDPKWNETPCTQTDIKHMLNPDTIKLTVIYRLTKGIISAVNTYMPELNIMSGRQSMIKESVQIRLWKSNNQKEEVKHDIDEAIKRANNNNSVGILLRTHQQIIDFTNNSLENLGKPIWNIVRNEWGKYDFGSLNNHLKMNGIPLQYVANGYGEFEETERLITITTYHSSKGLDFDTVFLPYCNYNDCLEKRLFMVAMTRSRKDLFISFSDKVNQYVNCFKDKCLYKNWNDSGNSLFADQQNSSEDLFGF